REGSRLRTDLSLPVPVRQRSTNLPRRSQPLANDSKRRLTKRHGHRWSASRAILMLRRRGRNSSILRKSERPFIRILMASSGAKTCNSHAIARFEGVYPDLLRHKLPRISKTRERLPTVPGKLLKQKSSKV